MCQCAVWSGSVYENHFGVFEFIWVKITVEEFGFLREKSSLVSSSVLVRRHQTAIVSWNIFHCMLIPFPEDLMDPIHKSNADWICIGRHLARSYAYKEFKMYLQSKDGGEVHIAQGNRRPMTSAANCSQRNNKFSVYLHYQFSPVNAGLMAPNRKLKAQSIQ